jgi:predicted PurR-regulated permease PerM
LPIDSLSQRLYSFEGNLQDVQVITNQLGSVKPLLKIITSTFSGLVAVFTFLVMTYYMLMERTNLNSHLHQLFKHESQAQQAIAFINKLEFQIGGWVRGELALMFIVGTITYFGLILLNIPYAIPLAILAGLLELIPNLGPTISAIPAIIVALLTSPNPLVAVFVVILYIFVQQFENNIIVPRVMKTAVGLHPLITIISIIIGLKLAGIAGGVLAVPLFLILKVTYTQLIEPKLRHQQSE